MAPFNPQVAPTQAPDFTNVGKPVTDWGTDKSTGMALGVAADALTGTVKLADTITKGVIKEDIDTGVNKLRDDTISVYQAVRNMQTNGITPVPGSQEAARMNAATLSEGGDTPVPAGLQNGLSRLNNVAVAQTQNGGGGKANDTLYTAAANAQLKQLRAQYPGYRDYIDEEYKKQSGIDPANAYMRNLLQDINAAGVGQKSEADKAIALGRQYLGADPTIPAHIEAVRQGLPGAVQNLENTINRVASDKYKFDNWKQQREIATANKTDNAETDTNRYTQQVAAAGYNLFNSVVQIPGLSTPATIQKLIEDQQAGKLTLTDEQNNALLGAAVQAQQAYQKQSLKIYNDYGYQKTMPDIKVRQQIVDDQGLIYTQMVDAIKSKEYGTLFGNQRRVASMQSDMENQIVSHEKIGKVALINSAWTKFAGPGWQNTQMATALQNGVASEVKNFTEDAMKRAQIPDDLRQDGKVKSLYSDIATAQQAKVPTKTKIYDNLVDNVKTIVDPKAPAHVKAEVAEYVFNPQKNSNIMKQFGRDFVDDQGRPHKGKFAVYDTLTEPKVTDNLWNMKDGATWQKYKDWQEISFKTLYGEELQNLNKIAADKSLAVKIEWNSDIHQFSLKYPKTTTNVEANYVNFAQQSVRNLNQGLKNLSYMKGKEGTDTSSYLLDTMMELGFSPNDAVEGNLSTRMMKAIANSKKSNRIEDAFSATK